MTDRKFTTKFHFFIGSLLFLTLVSCSLSNLQSESPAVNEIKSGNRFRVNLPENHTDGYTWQLNSTYNTKLVGYENSVWHGKSKGIDFNFSSLGVGQTTLTFVKRRYQDTICVKSFIVKISAD